MREFTLPTGVTPILVAYDIPENRRRTRLHRLLRGFGEPVQKSVFLCWLDDRRQQRLRQLLEDFALAPHQGCERINCIPARGSEALVALSQPVREWVFE